MYYKNKMKSSRLKGNPLYEGETIEQKMRRLNENKEPIDDATPAIYTDRKDGVINEYNIRADKFDEMIEVNEKITEVHKADREKRIGERTFDTMTDEQQKAFKKKFPESKVGNKNPETGANTSDSGKK